MRSLTLMLQLRNMGRKALNVKILFVTIIVAFVGLQISGQNQGDDSKWELVWEDDFLFFDSILWIKAHYCDHGGEPQLYLADNVTVEDGKLVIRAIREAVRSPEYPPDPTTWACGSCKKNGRYRFTSGWIETSPLYNTRFGLIEARMKVPHRYGLWPAFWTWKGEGVRSANEAEIDIFEMSGSKSSNVIGTNVHKYYCPGDSKNCDTLFKPLCPDDNPEVLCYSKDVVLRNFTYTDWHVYGLEWTPEKIVWYIDNMPIRELANPGIQDPIRIIINLAFEPWSVPLFFRRAPAEMMVDYVRVYKQGSEQE